MPTRPIVLAVVAFWLATTSWLVYREWLPWLTTQGAPPFIVDLVDEAAPQHVLWRVLRDGKEVAIAKTMMEPQRDDSFRLTNEVRNFDVEAPSLLPIKLRMKVVKLDTILWVNRDGELLRRHSHIELDLASGPFEFRLWADVAGEVRGDELHGTLTLNGPVGVIEEPLQPVPLTSRNVINPLMPLIRIRGLTPGRRWRLAAVDPLGDALIASLPQIATRLGGDGKQVSGLLGHFTNRRPKELLAEVQPATQMLKWSAAEYECFVIRYRADSGDFNATTWVRAADGEVLRQDVEDGGERLTLERLDVKAPRQ